MLMLLALVSRSRRDSAWSWKQALTRAWQSSKAPSTAKVVTLPPRVANCFSCSSEIRPLG